MLLLLLLVIIILLVILLVYASSNASRPSYDKAREIITTTLTITTITIINANTRGAVSDS